MKQNTKEMMKAEAVCRMELLNLGKESVEMFENGILSKTYTNHEEKRVYREEVTEGERKMIARIEEEKNILIYYVIKDEGLWPDGCSFTRYSFPYVDADENEYELVRRDCIGKYQTLPCYVVNMEDDTCSGKEEILYHVVGGKLINIS